MASLPTEAGSTAWGTKETYYEPMPALHFESHNQPHQASQTDYHRYTIDMLSGLPCFVGRMPGVAMGRLLCMGSSNLGGATADTCYSHGI